MTRIKMVCSHCGSDDVMRDAYAAWDTVNQDWMLCNVFDQAYCNQCGGETSLTAVELKEGQT